MPPDIRTASSALSGGTPAGRISGAAGTGPPGSDPLAALFASLLAQSGGPAAPAGLALLKPKALVLPVTDKTVIDPRIDLRKDKIATDKTLLTALPTLPPPILPIQMRAMETKPISLPNAGVTAGQKTMDTASALSPPSQGTKSLKPSGELILPPATALVPVVPNTFPILLIPAIPAAASANSPAPMVPSAVPTKIVPSLPSADANVSHAAAAAAPLVPQARLEALTASTGEVSPRAAAPAFASPVAALPKTFTVSSVVTPAIAPEQPSIATPLVAANADVVKSAVAPALSTPAYVPAPHGFAVPAEALPASVPTVSPKQAALPVPAPPALPTASVFPALTTLLTMVAPSSVVAPKSTEGKIATEGAPATESRQATDGLSSSTRPNSLPPVNMPEKGLKSAGAFADTITRIQAMPTPTSPTELTLPVIDKRSELRPSGDENAAATVLTLQTVATSPEVGRTEAKPLTAAERAEMVRQVADGVGAMRLTTQPGKADHMTLQLHPKDWGQLQISVIVTPGSQPGAAQAVTAHIVAETPQVKAALENHGGDLRQALREAGLNLDKMTVTVQSASASASAGTASGGHHGMNSDTSGFGQSKPDQGTGMSGDTNAGTPSFAAFAGHSQGGRQGGQPSAPMAVYSRTEPEREELPEAQAPRRLPLGQVDMRA